MVNTSEQRRQDIVELVKKFGKVRVSALSELYGISEVTIRGDLEYLEAQGSLTRVHGGAVGLDKLYVDMDLSERYNANSAQKKELAKQAAQIVSDNDTLFLNAGTTLTYVLRALKGKRNISIVTNSIANAAEAASYTGFNVILLGGLIDSKYQFTYGADTITQLGKYHATKCILSVDGINEQSGLTLYYSSEADIVRRMIDTADTVIVAADSSKIGKSAFARIAPLTAADIIVTNRCDSRAVVDRISELGVNIYEA